MGVLLNGEEGMVPCDNENDSPFVYHKRLVPYSRPVTHFLYLITSRINKDEQRGRALGLSLKQWDSQQESPKKTIK